VRDRTRRLTRFRFEGKSKCRDKNDATRRELFSTCLIASTRFDSDNGSQWIRSGRSLRISKSRRLSYLDSDARPAKVEDRVAEHVSKFPTTWRDTERCARAYRPQLCRVTVAAQTGLVFIRTRVARLHSHSTDLIAVPSWLCALRALQGHRRHDRLARLRWRRAVLERSRYRFAIGRSIPASGVT